MGRSAVPGHASQKAFDWAGYKNVEHNDQWICECGARGWTRTREEARFAHRRHKTEVRRGISRADARVVKDRG